MPPMTEFISMEADEISTVSDPTGYPAIPMKEGIIVGCEEYNELLRSFTKSIQDAGGVLMPTGDVLLLPHERTFAETHNASHIAREVASVLLAFEEYFRKDVEVISIPGVKGLVDKVLYGHKMTGVDLAGLWVVGTADQLLSLQKPAVSSPVSIPRILSSLESYDRYMVWLEGYRRQRMREQRQMDEDLRHGILPLPPRVTDEEATRDYKHRMETYRLRGEMLREKERDRSMATMLERMAVERAKDMELLVSKLGDVFHPRGGGAGVERTDGVTAVHGGGRRWAKYTGPKFTIDKPAFQWLRTYERVAEMEEYYSDQEKIGWLARALDVNDTRVWKWYEAVNRNKSFSWREFKQHFVGAFVPERERQPSALWQKIVTMRRTKAETIRQFQMRFAQALEDLEDANLLSPLPFHPTNVDKSTAWFTALNDRDMSLVALREDKEADIQDVMESSIEQWDQLITLRTTKEGTRGDDTPTATGVGGSSGGVPKIEEKRVFATPRTVSRFAPQSTMESTNKRARFNVGQSMPKSTVSLAPNRSTTTKWEDKTKVTMTNPAAHRPTINSQSMSSAINTKSATNDNVDQLADAFAQKLKIALGGSAQKFNAKSGSFTCFRCGEAGHTSRNCESDTVLPNWRGYLIWNEALDGQGEYDPQEAPFYGKLFSVHLESAEHGNDGADDDDSDEDGADHASTSDDGEESDF